MVQNFEFKDGYGFYKLRPSVGRSKMTNWLHASPVVEESMSSLTCKYQKLQVHQELGGMLHQLQQQIQSHPTTDQFKNEYIFHY